MPKHLFALCMVSMQQHLKTRAGYDGACALVENRKSCPWKENFDIAGFKCKTYKSQGKCVYHCSSQEAHN